MEIYLIRHTTPGVVYGTCYGRTDLPVSGTFDNEWKILKTKIPNDFDAVFSSPAQRCHKLAKVIGGDSVVLKEELWELNFGEWEMKRWDKIDGEKVDAWMDDFVNVRTPSGESFQDLYNRVMKFWGELITQPYAKVVVVTHGGVIRTLIAQSLGMPLKNIFRIGLDYSSVSLISTGEQADKVRYVNQ